MIKTNIELNQVLAIPQEGVPEWLLLIPTGSVIRGRDGREFKNPGATAVIENQKLRGVDTVIDVEHATELKAPKGDYAPAYGWITEYKEENGELWGKVDWTPKGLASLEDREYRYYSPAYRIEVEERAIIFVKSIGLTNSPNLALPALNQEETLKEGTKLDKILPSICLALGLNSEASESAVLSAINKFKETSALNSESLKTMMPKADYDVVLNRAEKAETELNSLKENSLKTRVSAVVDKAVEAGKIAPASKEYYATTCNSEEALKAFEDNILGKAPVVVTNSEETPDGEPDKKSDTELNAEEKDVATALGLNSEEALEYFGKVKKEQK